MLTLPMPAVMILVNESVLFYECQSRLFRRIGDGCGLVGVSNRCAEWVILRGRNKMTYIGKDRRAQELCRDYARPGVVPQASETL